MNAPLPKGARLLRFEEVAQRTALSRDSIYRLGREGRFPRPIKVSQWASRWVEAEVQAFIDARIAERDANAPRMSSKG